MGNSLPRWLCNLFVCDFLKKAIKLHTKQIVQVCVLIQRNQTAVSDLFDILVLMKLFGIK